MAEMISRNEDFLDSLQEGRRKMLSENFALIGETQMIQSLSQAERCAIEQIGEMFDIIEESLFEVSNEML